MYVGTNSQTPARHEIAYEISSANYFMHFKNAPIDYSPPANSVEARLIDDIGGVLSATVYVGEYKSRTFIGTVFHQHTCIY